MLEQCGTSRQRSTVLCACGCGECTFLATRTKGARGVTRGQPLRYIPGHQHPYRSRAAAVANFWQGVDRSAGAAACWPWTRSRSQRGYGLASIGGKHILAHRAAFSLTFGEPLPGFYIYHRCDNPVCCNPGHLFVGTPADNMADMVAKGRGRHPGPRMPLLGARAAAAKLTEEQVREIRARYAAGELQKDIAAAFDVGESNIGMIVCRKTWKHC